MKEKNLWYANSWLKVSIDWCVKWKLFVYLPILFLYGKQHLQKQEYLATEKELREKVLRHERKISSQETTIRQLIANMVISNSDLDDIPAPIAYKVKRGNTFKNNYCNVAYENDFLKKLHKTRADFINKTVFDLYPPSRAGIYNHRDLEIAFTGTQKVFTNIAYDSLGIQHINDVLKWRKIKGNDTLIGVLIYPERK
jgi:hypothetical protein